MDHFELTAGGFSAKYGDRLSSIPIVDIILEGGLPGGLPSFGDIQAKLDVGVGTGSTLTLFGMRSREDTNLDITDEDEPGEFGTIVNDAGNDLVSITLNTPGRLAHHLFLVSQP